MMIKVSNEFLEFNELIEVEKQIKLFEEISTTDGDFSYSFELAKTLTNTRILQNPQPDNISKLVYQKIPAQILSDDGALIHDGYMRIEQITTDYHCSFFGGNNNWFGMLSGIVTVGVAPGVHSSSDPTEVSHVERAGKVIADVTPGTAALGMVVA